MMVRAWGAAVLRPYNFEARRNGRAVRKVETVKAALKRRSPKSE